MYLYMTDVHILTYVYIHSHVHVCAYVYEYVYALIYVYVYVYLNVCEPYVPNRLAFHGCNNIISSVCEAL